MSETEQPTPQEVKYENPVVGAARAGVRAALEANEAVKNVRAGMEVKQHVKDITKRPNVYRAWMDSTDRVVGAMTKVDQNKLSTQLYKMKMGLLGAGLEASTWLIDTTIRVASWPGRVMIKGIGLGLGPFTAGASLELYLWGKAIDVGAKRGVFSTIEQTRAALDANKKIKRYHIAEASQWIKQSGKNVKELTTNILTGFAYPEGKPIPPPKTFGEKIKHAFHK